MKKSITKRTLTKAVPTTVSSKYQIVIPAIVRRQLQLKPGSTLLLSLSDYGHIIARLDSKHRIRSMRGVGASMWKRLGGTDAYVRKERASWDR